MENMTSKIKETIELLKKSDIQGCITGSSMLDEDFDEWDSHPDVDVFCYGTNQHIHAIDYCMMRLGFEPGKYDETLDAAESWKIQRIMKGKCKKNMPVSTVSLCKDGVVINLSCKPNQRSVCDVISAFDMSIVMIGYDIPTGYLMDLRGEDVRTAVPNPLRPIEYDLVDTGYWVRQFDRVVKYYNRGFDTRPMASFYLDLIDRTTAEAPTFSSEKGKEFHDSFIDEFAGIRQKIEQWHLEHKED